MPSAGYVIDEIGVAVDYWHLVNKPFVRFFFLTHGHSDHVDGLTPTWNYPIYCSPTTAKVVSTIKGVNIKLFRQLELETVHKIKDKDGKHFMDVTLIDADHCPGAVMFIMKGDFGRILCTGDFRYEIPKDKMNSASDLVRPPIGHKSKINFEILKEAPFDRIYLDTTNWKNEERFLPRKEIVKSIIELVESYKDCQFLIALPQLYLGREDFLIEIAMHFQSYISVSQDRMKVLEVLNMPDVFRTGHLDTAQFRLLPLSKGRTEFTKMLSFEGCNPYLIVPSSVAAKLNWHFHENVRCISYSDHCDRFEIESFLKELNVRKIVGVPNTLTNAECKRFLSGVPPKKFAPLLIARKQRLRLKPFDRERKRKKLSGFEYPESQDVLEVSQSVIMKVKKTASKRRLFNEKADNNCQMLTEPNDDDDGGRKKVLPLRKRRFVRDTLKDFQVSDKEFIVLECIINGDSGLICDDPDLKRIAEQFANENVEKFFNS